MICLYFSVLFFGLLRSEGECNIQAATPLTFEATKACMTSIPISNTSQEFTDTLETLESMVDMNVFIDISENPPAPHENLIVDLKKAVTDLRNTQPTNTDEFYSSIAAVFNRQKDPHSVFYKPCAQKFFFVLPYGLQAWKDSDSGNIRLKLGPLASTYTKVTEEFEKTLSGTVTSYLGYELLKMNISGGELPEESAAETLAYWANETVYLSKLAPARFNQAVKSDFAMRNQKCYPIPEGDGYIAVSLQKITEDGAPDGDPIETQLPWYGWSTANITNLNDVCEHKNRHSNSGHKAKGTPLSRFQEDIKATLAFPTTPSASSRANSNLEHVVDAEDVQFYVWTSENVGYLRISSFYPKPTEETDDIEAMRIFVQGIIASLKVCAERKLDRLVVDVRSNGGGYVALGMRTLQYLRHSLYPVLGKYDIRVTDIHDDLISVDDLLISPKHKYLSLEKFADDRVWYTEHRTKNFTRVENGEVKPFTHDYSQLYTMEICEDELTFEDLYVDLLKGAPIEYDPQHLFFVTDGLCGSTCSCFIKHASESRVGRIIGTGEFPLDANAAYDVGSFAGGSVLDSDALFEKKDKYPDLPHLPKYWYRESTVLRWAFEEIYSFTSPATQATSRSNDESQERLLEFVVNEPDFRLPIFPVANELTEERIEQVLNGVKPYFNQCVPEWEVMESANCAANNTKHRIYGHPCVTSAALGEVGGFDVATCKFARCETGYYRSLSEIDPDDGEPVCVAVPAPASGGGDDDDDDDNKFVKYYLPPMILGIAVIIAVCVCVIVILRRRSNKNNYNEIDG